MLWKKHGEIFQDMTENIRQICKEMSGEYINLVRQDL